MKTSQDFQECYEKYGLLETIQRFVDFVEKETHHFVYPSFTSIGHVILDDYNWDDMFIEHALEDERINEHLIYQFSQLPEEEADYLSDNDWENFAYWALIEGTELIIEFLKWMLTIPEEERFDHLPDYMKV